MKLLFPIAKDVNAKEMFIPHTYVEQVLANSHRYLGSYLLIVSAALKPF